MSQTTVVPITQPTGLRRIDAARHCSISPSHFDKLVADGILPAPRFCGSVKLWLRQELDDALFALPSEKETDQNAWDRLLG